MMKLIAIPTASFGCNDSDCVFGGVETNCDLATHDINSWHCISDDCTKEPHVIYRLVEVEEQMDLFNKRKEW